MKPRILMTAEEVFDPVSHRHYYMTKRSYSLAVSAAGGLGLMAIEPRLCAEYAKICDGLLLTDGSADINPARYGEEVIEKNGYGDWYSHGFQYGRDSLEITLCKAFLKEGKPIMGIGRGMYILNTVFGGTCFQDIAEELHLEHPVGVSHLIWTEENTQLRKIMGESALVNSYHHQAVKILGDGLRKAAVSKDGLIEALWHESLPVFGVQWNPETFLTTDEEDRKKNMEQKEDISASPAEQSVYWENQLTMTADEGYPVDADRKISEAHPLFRALVSLCEERRAG